MAALMLEKPSVIKRPVLVKNGKVQAIGFSGQYDENLFARSPHPNPLPQAGEGANE